MKSPTSDHMPEAPPAPISFGTHVRAVVVGYDIFISYRHVDAKDYVLALREHLRKRHGLTCFVDVADAGRGARIEKMKAIACTARTLIVVVTDGAFDSRYIREEVAEYRSRRMLRWWRRPLSRIVPIDVDGALSRAPDDLWKTVRAHSYESESADAVRTGAPSKEVITEIVRSASFVRTSFVAAVLAVIVALVVVGMLLFGMWQVNDVERDLATLRDEREALSRRSSRFRQRNRALLTLRDELTATNAGLVQSTATLQARANDLQRRRTELEVENEKLSIEGKALLSRTQAQRIVDEDPVRALRLVEQSESTFPSEINNEIIRRAITTWDLTYTHELDGCTIEDAVETKLLLRCEPGDRSLVLFDLARGTRTSLRIAGGRWARIVGDGAASRVLVTDTDHRLFELDGRTVGTPMPLGVGWSSPVCSRTRAVVIHSSGSATRWDLLADKREHLTLGFGEPRSREFYGCRDDGAMATIEDEKLLLVDALGRPVTKSITNANLTAFSTTIAWSPNGRGMAIATDVDPAEPSRFGIWRPDAAVLDWLVEGKDVPAFAWSTSGGLLAFSWRDAQGAIVELTTTDDPAGRRRRIATRLAARAMAFSPNDRYVALLGEDGGIELIDLSGARPTRRARHPGATAIDWVADRLVTWSDRDHLADLRRVRVWTVEPARARWLFVVDQVAFGRCAAADPRSRWLAARYNATSDRPSGILVRELATGAEHVLADGSKLCRQMSFTRDGEWMIAIGGNQARLWNTRTWKRHDLFVDGDSYFVDVVESPAGLELEAIDPEPAYRHYAKIVRLDRSHDPRVIDRAPARPRAACSLHLPDEIPGWIETIPRARSTEDVTAIGAQHCPGVPWQVRFWCRPENQEEQHCDVEFVPTDVNLARRLVDRDFAP
jgi:hypothetical protein